MYFCAQMHLLISPGVHASPQPRTEITGMRVSDIRSQVLMPGQQPWGRPLTLGILTSNCFPTGSNMSPLKGSLHSQPRCSKPGKQLQTHSWDTRNTTQSQGTHIHHGRTLRAVCKWDTATTQNSVGNPWHSHRREHSSECQGLGTR